MINPTYRQSIKEQSRQVIWNRAVSLLTKDRHRSRILEEGRIRRLWDYAFEEHLLKYNIVKNVDEKYLDGWIDFADHTYGNKSPSDLRIAYFCGPEPQNDLDILVELGVRIENIWAFEKDKSLYGEALDNAKKHYPTLKIFSGSIQSFFSSFPIQFDIICLDFTTSIFSNSARPFDAINKVFENQSLSELSILVTNSCIPDKTNDTSDFLTSFFLHQPFVEGAVYGEKKASSGEIITWSVEGPDCYGYDWNNLKKRIDANWNYAYSAFASQYPILYGAVVQPAYRVLRLNELKKQIFSKDSQLHGAAEKISSTEALMSMLSDDMDESPLGGDLIFEPSNYPLWHQMLALKDQKNNPGKYWYNYFCQKESGISRFDAIKLGDVLRSSLEGYFDALSPQLKSSIPKIIAAIPDSKGGLFCDVPLPNLWIEVALNQLGLSYHCNVSNHYRGAYKAKTRSMMFDVFVFDRCRSFYDWLPMLESYGNDLTVPERQVIARSCIDSIGKQRRWIIPYTYFGSALIGESERSWAEFPYFPPRCNIKDV